MGDNRVGVVAGGGVDDEAVVVLPCVCECAVVDVLGACLRRIVQLGIVGIPRPLLCEPRPSPPPPGCMLL